MFVFGLVLVFFALLIFYVRYKDGWRNAGTDGQTNKDTYHLESVVVVILIVVASDVAGNIVGVV